VKSCPFKAPNFSASCGVAPLQGPRV
jgi:hypothetical protein